MPGTDGPQSQPGPVESVLLGGEPTLTGAEVARAAGLSVTRARRVWRALGFADPGDDLAFTAADAEMLASLARTSDAIDLDFDVVLKLVRAAGQTTARLADWQIGTLTAELEDDSRPGEYPGALGLATRLGPLLDEVLRYAWRRHVAAAIGRLAALDSAREEQQVPQLTVGFADLVGFTALSNELDEDEIGDLVEIFESRCTDVVTSHHGRVVKALGDSVLFVCGTPEQGIDIALDIIGVIGGDDRLPDVHLGMATGPVVLRMGDVFGPVVNLASRFTGVARRNRVIIDQATAALLPDDEFETRTLPARPIRGFGDVEPVTVRRTRPRH